MVEPRRPRLRLERTVCLVARLGEVRRRRHAQRLGIADVERAGRVGPARPLLAGDRVVVERGRVDLDRASRLGAVDQDRQAGFLPQLRDWKQVAGHPRDVRQREQARARPDLGEEPLERLRGLEAPRRRDPDTRPRRVQRPEQPEVLLVRGHDLVVRAEPEPGEDDVAAVRGRRRQRDVVGGHADQRRQLAAHALAQRPRLRVVAGTCAPLREVDERLRHHRLRGLPRERAVRAGVEIGDALEDRKRRSGFLERHETVSSTGAWSESTTPF